MSYNIDKSNSDLEVEYVKSILSYNHLSGEFTWNHRNDVPKEWNTQNEGKIAGRHIKGYRSILIKGKPYKSHRLAWVIFYGEWPNQEIDHINGIKDDNRICNLRLVDRVSNGHNRKAKSNSGLLGVSWCKKIKKWVSYTRINNKKKNLGSFDCPASASFAYQIAVHNKIGINVRMQ